MFLAHYYIGLPFSFAYSLIISFFLLKYFQDSKKTNTLLFIIGVIHLSSLFLMPIMCFTLVLLPTGDVPVIDYNDLAYRRIINISAYTNHVLNKLVYPMVRKRCTTTTGRVRSEDVESMTDEIYNAIETRETTELNNNIENRIRTTQTPIRESKREPEIKRPEITKNEIQKKIDNREEIRETRQMNRGLRDLIKILLIREFINRPGPRPPMPPRPNYRPPFRPGQGVGNFPLNRDNMNYDYNIYEY